MFEYLENYHWPGNVRELVNLVQVLTILSKRSGVVKVSDLPMNMRSADYEVFELRRTGDKRPSMNGNGFRELILSSLEATNGNKSAAARKLGISRSTFYKYIKDLGIS